MKLSEDETAICVLALIAMSRLVEETNPKLGDKAQKLLKRFQARELEFKRRRTGKKFKVVRTEPMY